VQDVAFSSPKPALGFMKLICLALVGLWLRNVELHLPCPNAFVFVVIFRYRDKQPEMNVTMALAKGNITSSDFLLL
jgi:hypothetical protein